MGAEKVDYARLLREVLPLHLLEAPLRRVVEESLAGGDEATLHGVCSLVLESLCAKGHFVRGAPGEAAEGARVFHDRQGVLRITLRPPEPPAVHYGVSVPPLLPLGFAAEEAGRALEAALTGASTQPTDDELGDSLRRIAHFIGKIRPETRVLFIGLSYRLPSASFTSKEASILASAFHQYHRSGGGSLYVPDLAADPALRARAEELGARSAAAFPLRAGEEIFGVLEAHHPRAGAFDENALGVLSLIALLAAGWIRSARHFEKMISIDLLTGVYTRRFFEEQILRELERANRDSMPLALVMVDLDNFKDVNDRFGHPVGDAVLARVAEILRDNVRRIDLVTRYGGEEFAILLPGASRAQSKVICERIRALVEAAPIPSAEGGAFRLTTSIGVALHPENTTAGREAPEVRRELLDRADRALYEAKRAGKNRVIFWKEEERA